MFSLDLTKSSEVRKVGDWPNSTRPVQWKHFYLSRTLYSRSFIKRKLWTFYDFNTSAKPTAWKHQTTTKKKDFPLENYM